ncbi:DUF397 domain-containing protein [Streptomyces carminius]|uniref:DUF397 domain-containing protein n=1 Tax=Streptomyces carminius TaxID=2665496 RepID=A0A2M8LW81_9ACTN|nr:DUF397 domain-containing protein [Streptomyces carminius]PJE96227.1 DUF397 domain-containing protein [Streptomyces carminius]
MSELVWVKSSFSEAGGNNCVEIAVDGENTAIRDSTAPEQVVTTSSTAFRTFVSEVKTRTGAHSAGGFPSAGQLPL